MADEATETAVRSDSFIDILPYDCVIEVLLRLGPLPRSLVAVSQVDHRFHEAANDPLLWRRQAEHRVGARNVQHIRRALGERLVDGGPSFETALWKRCTALPRRINVDIEARHTDATYWVRSSKGTTAPYYNVTRTTLSLSQVLTHRMLALHCSVIFANCHVWLTGSKRRFPSATCSSRVRVFPVDQHGHPLGGKRDIVPLRFLSPIQRRDARAGSKLWYQNLVGEAFAECLIKEGPAEVPTIDIDALVVCHPRGAPPCPQIPECVVQTLEVLIDPDDAGTQRGAWYAPNDKHLAALAHLNGCTCNGPH